MKEVLKLEHIQKYYGAGGNLTKAIDDISFSVYEGEFVGIMGASGSGKTTMLNCISTIDTVRDIFIWMEKMLLKSGKRKSPGSGVKIWALFFRTIICWMFLRSQRILHWL